MVALYFVPSKIPRTWTKRQWKEAWRWVRVTRKQLDAAMTERLAWLAAYGTTHPKMAKDIMNEAINPPLLMGPGMEQE